MWFVASHLQCCKRRIGIRFKLGFLSSLRSNWFRKDISWILSVEFCKHGMLEKTVTQSLQFGPETFVPVVRKIFKRCSRNHLLGEKSHFRSKLLNLLCLNYYCNIKITHFSFILTVWVIKEIRVFYNCNVSFWVQLIPPSQSVNSFFPICQHKFSGWNII